MFKKALAILLSLVFALTLLVGCNNSQDRTDTSSTDNSKGIDDSVGNESNNIYDVENMKFDNVKIKVASRYTEGGDEESEYYISKVKEFNEMDNGITVEMINITAEADYLNRLSTDFASGDAPNVFQEYGGSRCLDYLESGALLDLSPYLNAYPDWLNGFYSTNWTPVKFDDYGYEGTYGVPWGAYQVLLYYNKPILDKYNIEVPETFEDLMEACEILTKNGESSFIVGEKDTYRFGHLHTVLSIKTFGPDIAMQLANREATYDGEEMLSSYSTIKEMVDKGYLGESLLNTGVVEERAFFGDGMCAFMYDTSRSAASLQDTELLKNKEIGVTTFPYVNEEYKNVEMGGASSAYYISTMNATDEQIAASVLFLKYITNTDFINGLISVYPNTYSIKNSIASENYLYNDILEQMSKTEEYVTDLQNYDSASHMITTVRNALQILAMDGTPEEVGKQIMDEINNYE